MMVDTALTRRRSLREFARQVSAEPLSDATQPALLDAARRGDAEALQSLLRPHLRFVVDEAVAHRGGDASLEALVDAGLDGLRDAASTFDPADGAFDAHARRSIRASIRSRLLRH